MITFTQYVKEDIATANAPYALVRKKALLAGFFRFGGYFAKRNNENLLFAETNNAKVAKYIFNLVKEIYDADVSFSYLTNQRFNKSTRFVIVVRSKIREIIEDLSLSFMDGTIPRKVVYSDDTAAGYATGAFLASGSVTSPKSTNYHLEITTSNETLAKRFAKLIERFDKANFTPKIQKRRDKYCVYLKKSNQIGEFLIFIGAVNSSLLFENIRIERDMQNSLNRVLLCDKANYAKTVKSSQKQIENIKIVKKYYGDKPEDNEKLAALMELRLEREDATMSELAELLSERLNLDPPVTKSNINHLFIKIRQLAEKALEENE